jgi:glucose/arabinose dehydrogenase
MDGPNGFHDFRVAGSARSFPAPDGLRPLAVAAVMAASIVATAGLPARGDTPPNTLTEAERRGGWRLLFDGHSIDAFRGWRRDDVPRGWEVEDGSIVRKSAGAGDLLTRDTFEHFELVLDYRISPGGNSGVLFHVTESAAAAWMSGPEVQILDNAAGADRVKAGWLYGLYEPKVPEWLVELEERSGKPRREWLDATRPAGEWNRLSLRLGEDSGEVCVNGVRYVKFRKGDEEWSARVAASKFGALPDFGKAARGHLCFQDHGDEIGFRSIKLRELDREGRPVGAITDAELAVKAEPAFPGITWEGWSHENDDGTPAEPLRPLTVTHAGDGSGRRFVLDQSGMVHVVPNDLPSDAPRAKLFLDLRATTAPWRTANEEGLLGLAFHPQFPKTRAFFVCYCLAGEPRRQRISRFRVAEDDPDRADPASEEVLLEFEQPLANHNGGSIVFGPDGFLYAGIGDGGGRDDPLRTAQRLDTILGKILRIDVDRREADRAYAVPVDNPFAGTAGARAEIFALGFRNPWQISFDRKTGRLWTADVGQDLHEEIDIVEKGGNYGWSLREGSGPFGPDIAETPMIDPIWEYDHGLGKSIVGGFVVRGSSLPDLEGGYLYGDHVAGKLWLLRPHANPRQTVNASVPWNGLPVFGFGQDEAGSVYVLTSSPTGQGVHRLIAARPRSRGTSGRQPVIQSNDRLHRARCLVVGSGWRERGPTPRRRHAEMLGAAKVEDVAPRPAPSGCGIQPIGQVFLALSGFEDHIPGIPVGAGPRCRRFQRVAGAEHEVVRPKLRAHDLERTLLEREQIPRIEALAVQLEHVCIRGDGAFGEQPAQGTGTHRYGSPVDEAGGEGMLPEPRIEARFESLPHITDEMEPLFAVGRCDGPRIRSKACPAAVTALEHGEAVGIRLEGDDLVSAVEQGMAHGAVMSADVDGHPSRQRARKFPEDFNLRLAREGTRRARGGEPCHTVLEFPE